MLVSNSLDSSCGSAVERITMGLGFRSQFRLIYDILTQVTLLWNLLNLIKKLLNSFKEHQPGQSLHLYAIYLFMADLQETILNGFWGETYDMMEIHRQHFLYLGAWSRTFGKISQ